MLEEDATGRRRWFGAGRAGAAGTATGRHMSRNMGVQLAGRALVTATALATVPITARALEPEGFGELVAGLAYVTIFLSLTELGLTTAAVNRMAAEPARESEWLGALVTLRMTLAALVTIVCAATVPLVFRENGDVQVVTLALTLAILPSAVSSFMTVYQVRLRAGVPQALLVAQGLLWLATVVVLALLGSDTLAFAVGWVVSVVFLASLQLAVARHVSPVAWRAGWRHARPLLKLALPLGIAGVMILVYYRIDAVLLLELSGSEEAGVYGVAYRLLEPLVFVPGIVMATFFPVLSAVIATDVDRARRLVQRCAETMLIITVPCLAVSIALAEPLVTILFGEAYERSAGVLPILMAALVTIGFGYLAGYLAPVLGLQWRLAAIACAGAAFNIALNLVLIPRYGAYGAASATLVTETLTMTVMLATALRALRMRLALHRLVRTAIAGAGMVCVMLGLRSIGVFVALVVGALVYPALLVVLRSVRVAELRELRDAIGGLDDGGEGSARTDSSRVGK